MGNLAQNLLDTAAKHGRRPALRMGNTVLTYHQFVDAAGRVAAGLEARGIMPGDRVGMVLPNVLSFPILFYGAMMAGAAVVPISGVHRHTAGPTLGIPTGYDSLAWVANSATLIYGTRDAILVDTFLTLDQSVRLADGVAASGKNLTHVYITHGHGDHYRS